MLDGQKLVKLIVQSDLNELFFFRQKKDKNWSLLTAEIEEGEFPESAARRLVESELESGLESLRLLKVLETDDEQLHLYNCRLKGYSGMKEMKKVTIVEAKELELAESDRVVIIHYEKVFFRPWNS